MMNKFKINQKQILRALSFGLVLTIIFSTVGCSKTNITVDMITFSKEDATDIRPSSPEKNLHVTSDASGLKEIAKSGLVTLFIDESTYSVAVLESLSQKYWYSLPLLPPEYTGAYDYSAAPVTLTVVNGNETIYLNSQDNSVAFDNVSYTIKSEKKDAGKDEETVVGVTINYIITVDDKTANKEKFEKTDIAFLLSLDYTLEDGSLYVSSKTLNLSDNQKAKIVNLGLLAYLGASTGAEQGDFILVPDESGALINTAVEQTDFKKMNFVVYGENPPASDSLDEKPAVIAAYGIKNGESAMAALVESGNAVACISADRAMGSTGLNKVGADFSITEYKDIVNKKTINRYISRESYTEEIKLCLRFLSGGNATYSGMAAVCREQLIRDKKLSTKTVETGDYLPFNLTTVGSIKKNIIPKIPIKTTSKLTTFEQALDMLTRLKSKGINSVFLRYKGALSGGLNQTDISKSKLLRSLGGEKGFTELNDYMITQNMNLFLDINILSSLKRRSLFGTAHAETILGENRLNQLENKLSTYIGEEYLNQSLRPIKGIDKAVLDVLTTFRNIDIEGFCLNDTGKILYSDFSKEPYNRQSAAKEIAEQITSLSTGRKMMADNGNFYMIKNVDIISNIPMSLAITEDENPPYQTVPFIQLILHGIVDYSGAPINEAFDPEENSESKAEDLFFEAIKSENQKELKDAMLRCIEYGACPSYEWNYKELSKSDSIETYYYDDWMNQAVDFYLKANTALADLRGARMIKHSQIKPGVFCTEYEGSNLIYVNYTTSDVDIGGMSVKARNFIRIY